MIPGLRQGKYKMHLDTVLRRVSIFNFDEATTQCNKKQTKGALVDWLWDNLKTKIITERKILKTTEKNRNPWAHIKNTDTVRF